MPVANKGLPGAGTGQRGTTKSQSTASPKRVAARAGAQGTARQEVQGQTLSVAILSGKGGVGKSNVTLNLGLALQNAGARVLVLDGDLGLANVDVLMGFTPGGTLWDVLQGRTDLASVLHTDVSGLNVLPAASGTGNQAQLDAKSCQQLIKSVRPLAEKHDFVLLDLGAGLSDTVRLLARACAVPLLVTTPEPTAIADAYALIKVLNKSHNMSNFQIACRSKQEVFADNAQNPWLHTPRPCPAGSGVPQGPPPAPFARGTCLSGHHGPGKKAQESAQEDDA